MSTIQIYRRRGEFLEIELADFVALLEQSRSSLAAPLSAERMGIVNDLSSRLLADRSIVDRPAMAYFAHWTRRAALRDLARRFEASLPADTLAAPRGIVLHIPPRNVETIFLFLLGLSFLTGNSNVVRLPRQAGGAVMQAVDLLVDRLSAEVCQTQFFIHSPIDLSISSALSSTADARVVWGGDEKIAAFETLPLRNGGKAIWFGDRYSYAVLAGDALKAAGPHEIEALARKLCTDIFTFDQMGCSSPHKLFIVGDPAEHGGIVVTLAGAVRDEASRRGIDISLPFGAKNHGSMRTGRVHHGSVYPRLERESHRCDPCSAKNGGRPAWRRLFGGGVRRPPDGPRRSGWTEAPNPDALRI